MAQVILIRHAVAVERKEWAGLGRPDSERPLSDKGIRRLRRSALGLKSLVPKVSRILTSPFLRTLQTADVLSSIYEGAPVEECSYLEPGGSSRDCAELIRSQLGQSAQLIIGHEPNLSMLLSELLEVGAHFTHFKKAGAACICFEPELTAPNPKLLWYMLPRSLRQLSNAIE